MLPVTCRSADSRDAGGFALGADALNSLGEGEGLLDGALDGAGAEDFVAASESLLGEGSLILLLENIVSCLDIDHRVHGLATHTHFVVQMNAGHTSRGSHITNPLSARDPLAHFHAKFRHMRITGFNAEFMLDFDQPTIS